MHDHRAIAIFRVRCMAVFGSALIAVPVVTAADIVRSEIFPGVHEVQFTSQVLGSPHKLAIVQPPALASGNRSAPVLFLLHGRGRHHRSLVDLPAIRQLFLAAPFYTVLPQGDDGWYIDSPVQTSQRYETYLLEVIALAATLAPLDKNPARRAIAGWSMGGYGAVRFAIQYPESFGVVGAMIGLLDFPRASDLPAGRNYVVPIDRFGADPQEWKRFNPLPHAAALRGHAIYIMTAEESFDRVMNEHFHAELESLGISHRYTIIPGAHTFDVVQAALPELVAFVANQFRASADERAHRLPLP